MEKYFIYLLFWAIVCCEQGSVILGPPSLIQVASFQYLTVDWLSNLFLT